VAREQSSNRLGWAVHISLLGGLVISGALLILGATLTLTSHARHSPSRPAGVETLVARSAKGDGTAILDLGFLVLMLTPVLRVIVLAVGWLTDRKWRLGMIALCVLALLLTSMILGTG